METLPMTCMIKKKNLNLATVKYLRDLLKPIKRSFLPQVIKEAKEVTCS